MRMQRLSLLSLAFAGELARAVREVPNLGDATTAKKHTFLKLKVPRGASISLAEVRSNGTSFLQGTSVTKGFPEELAFFEEYPAVQERWINTITHQDASPGSIAVLQQVMAWEVPGLGGAKFSEVLGAVQERCPLWIVGGAVRDLVVGETPNDIDCIALCETSDVAQVAESNGWKHIYTPGQAYFAIGDTHGDNPNYLEGFSGDLLFTDPDMAEMTTSILLWGLSSNTVVDPSGTGVSDAMKKLLRPAVPDPVGTFKKGTGAKAKKLWATRQAWLKGGFAGPRLARHVRYLKMRMRGWEPADDCVRAFMANVLAAMVYVERVFDDVNQYGQVEAFGTTWPHVPLATLMMLMDKFESASDKAKAAAMQSLLGVYEADMTAYLAGTAGKACSKKWEAPMVIDMDKETPTGVWWKSNKPKTVKNVIKKGIAGHCLFAVMHDAGFKTICDDIKKLSAKL